MVKKTHDNLDGADLYYQLTSRVDGTERLSFHVQDGDDWVDVTKRVWRAPFAKEWCELHEPEDAGCPRVHGFWGRYSWLSNFHIKPITMSGECWGGDLDFPSSEHAYQFAKLPQDDRDKWYERVCQYTCSQVKQWGRNIQIRGGWEYEKEGVMSMVVGAKFHQNRDLRDKLLALGGVQLVESNWWGDVFYGADPTAPVNGLNTLGRILMSTRDALSG